MWKCHKCGKPVFFAERKQSLGYDWHPECLRCEECGKRLNPGQHAEHKGVPYCHVPCYGALFGPQLFGHGTRVESHKSFGQQRESPKLGTGPTLPRSQLESKLKLYNQYFDGKSGEIRSREVNGRLILEGSLRIHWGVQAVIHLKENDDQRTVVTVRKRNSYRLSSDFDSDEDSHDVTTDSSCNDTTCSSDIMMSSTDTLSPDKVFPEELINKSDTEIESGSDLSITDTTDLSSISPSHKSFTLPPKLDIKSMEWDELDELLQVERKVDETEKMYQTMPVPLPSQTSVDSSSSTYSTESSSTTEKANSGNNQTSELSLTTTMNGSDFTETTSKTITKPILSKDDSWIDTSIHLNRSMSGPDCLERIRNHPESPEFDRSTTSTSCDITSFADTSPYTTSTENTNTTQDTTSTDDNTDEVVLRKAAKTGSTAIKRRPGKRLSRSKIKRRCSINGHFYDRETSFFTPPHGSQMSVWVSSLVSTQEVINLMLEKYKVDSVSNNFALFVMRDNGEQKRLKDDDYPLISRVLLGPHEDVVRLFLMDSNNTQEVSNEVAQFLNLSLAECKAILNQYYTQEEREIAKIRSKYLEMKKRIKHRMEDLKVRL